MLNVYKYQEGNEFARTSFLYRNSSASLNQNMSSEG